MYTLRLLHTAMMNYITVSYTAVKNDIPNINLLCHVYCDSSHLSVLQTAQCVVAIFKRGWLYNNQTLIKLAAAHPEMCALKWALLVRNIRQKSKDGLEIRGRLQRRGCSCDFYRHMWFDVGWRQSSHDQMDSPSVYSFPISKPEMVDASMPPERFNN